MRKYTLFLLLIIISSSFFACQQDPNNNSNPTPDDYFVTFDLDGTPIEYRTTTYQCNLSSGTPRTIGSSIVEADLNNLSAMELIRIHFNMNEDSITYHELQSQIGQNLAVCFSSSTSCHAPVHISVDYKDGTNNWSTDADNNIAPTNYLKINSVQHSPIIPLVPAFNSLVIVEGEFNLVFDDGSSTLKHATNGKFRLLFPEYR